MKKLALYLLLFLIIFSLFSCSSSQNLSRNTDGRPKAPGKCYIKSKNNPKPSTIDIPFAYIGVNTHNNPTLTKKRITIQEPYDEWVKKQANGNCLSPNPEDCLVWCHVKQPGIYKDIYIVNDTINNKDFITRSFSIEPTVSDTEWEWEECVCQKDITPSLLTDVQLALTEKDFYSGHIDGTFSQAFKEAIFKYQKSHYLPLGGLTIKFLDHLGVNY